LKKRCVEGKIRKEYGIMVGIGQEILGRNLRILIMNLGMELGGGFVNTFRRE
jgi:hypothetical protein